jgi:hypothetical protein
MSWSVLQGGVLAIVCPAPASVPVVAANITTFDVVGALDTNANAINEAARTARDYTSTGHQPYHAFLRAPDGKITSFDSEGSIETVPNAINGKNVVAGS